MKPIPEDTGSFLAIRTANPQMLYVDKTAYLHRLVSSSRKCLFLAPGKPVWLIGLSFERGTRRFVDGAVLQVAV